MINTIDLDSGDKHNLIHIIGKVATMPCLDGLTVKDSARKGFHIKMWCNKPGCDLCRLAYDDPVRFSFDQYRPAESQNVLWSEKIPHARPKMPTYQVGDRVEFFNKMDIWVSGVIVDFHVNSNRNQAVIKCFSNPSCKGHKICVASLYLRLHKCSKKPAMAPLKTSCSSSKSCTGVQ
jgi:hypothetical protein